MTRKLIIDCDPGVDDAVALCLALFDPRVELLAVTATGGTVSAAQASRNVQTVVEMLDPARWPRMGASPDGESPVPVDLPPLHGADGLANLGAKISELHHPHLSDKVINDEIRNHPGEVTLVCLGPLTNVARAFSRDPELTTLVGRVVIAGGTVIAPGNTSPSAEANMASDPQAARLAFRTAMPKTLVPLDVTSQVVMTMDFLDQLPDEETRAGHLLRHLIPFWFRAHRQHLGQEGIHLDSAVALMAAIQPDLFGTEEMAGDVEVAGELTTGTTVFDRRSPRQWRVNMEVAMTVDQSQVRQAIIRGLKYAGQETVR